MTTDKLELKNSDDQDLNSATIDEIVKGNPDVSHDFLRKLLVAQAQVAAGKVEPFEFG